MRAGCALILLFLFAISAGCGRGGGGSAADWEDQAENHGLLEQMQALIDSYGKSRVAVPIPQSVVIEQAPPDTLFYNPRHPYTRALIAAQPTPDIARPIDLNMVAKGAGSPASWPEEYRFEGVAAPALMEVEPGHKVRCHV